MKKISIMLTSYNLVDCIDESISSVVSQEMPCDWELLIGDDGSDDGTIEKIKNWQSKYPNNIRYYVADRPKTIVKDGKRAAKNRAKLLEKATGDYLIYLDGDDYWIGIEKLKQQFAILEDPVNSDCSCCAHNIEVLKLPENKIYNWIEKPLSTQKFTLKQYWSSYYFHTNTILFRKECKPLLLDNLYRDYLNDTFITFILLQYGKVYYIDKAWARYNMTGTGLWTGHSQFYGLVRNTLSYDLELKINNKIRTNIMQKHWPELLYIINNYNDCDYPSIAPVVEGIDPSVFKTTLLLTKVHPNLIDKIRKQSIKVRIFIHRSLRWIIRLLLK